MNIDDVQILDKTSCFRGFFCINKYQLRFRLFAGEWSRPVTRELFERGDACGVLLFDPKLERVVLAEQFRLGALRDPAGPWLLELIAGIIEPGETPAQVAEREAHEEADLAITALMPICQYWPSPGGSNEQVTLFCGQVDASDAGGLHGNADEVEDIKLHVLSANEAFAAVKSGRINNAPGIIALQWLEMNYVNVKEQWCQ